MAASILTEAAWHRERFTTCRDIATDIRNASQLLSFTERDVRDQMSLKPTKALEDIEYKLTDLVYAYNTGFSTFRPPMPSRITDETQIPHIFERSKKLAQKAYNSLRDGSVFKVCEEELEDVRDLRQACELVRKVVEVDLPKWEKRVSDVAEMGRMLTA